VLLQQTVQFATSMLLITATQTGLCWHRLKPSHSKYKKLHSPAVITPSYKQDSTCLPRRTTSLWEYLYMQVPLRTPQFGKYSFSFSSSF
jgi:hypothetical protein